MRRYRALTAGIIGVAMLSAACGTSGNSGGSGGNSAPAGQTTIDVWINGTEKDQGALMKELVPAFEAKNPGIKVKTTIVDWSTANQQILAAAAGGGLPDVMTFYSVDLPGFAAKNVLLPLADQLPEDKYLKNAVELSTWGGQWYAAPWTLKARTLAVREDFAKEAGLNADQIPATWSELEDWANKLVVRDGDRITRSGFWVVTSHPYKTIQQFIPFLWSNGGRMFTADGCKAAFQGKEGVEALTFLNKLLNQDKVDFAGSVQADNVDLGQGKVAMVYSNIPVRGWTKDFPDLAKKNVVGFNPTPHSEGHTSYTEIGGNYLGIAKTSKNPQAAAKFVEYMTADPEAAAKAAALDSDVIPLVAGADSQYTKSNPAVQRLAAIIGEAGAGLPKHPDWPKIQNTVTAAISSVYLDKQDPAKALENAATEVDAVLASSKTCAEETPNK